MYYIILLSLSVSLFVYFFCTMSTILLVHSMPIVFILVAITFYIAYNESAMNNYSALGVCS